MARSKDPSDMKLTSVLKEWIDKQEWKCEIEFNDERNGAWVDTRIGIDDQGHRLVFETDEVGEIFSVYLFSTFNVAPVRMADMSRILNRLNCGFRLGHFLCGDDEDSNPVCFQHAIDVEGSDFVPKQIDNMLNEAVGAFMTRGELLASVALTKRPVDVLWASFLENQEKLAKAQEQSGPSEL